MLIYTKKIRSHTIENGFHYIHKKELFALFNNTAIERCWIFAREACGTEL